MGKKMPTTPKPTKTVPSAINVPLTILLDVFLILILLNFSNIQVNKKIQGIYKDLAFIIVDAFIVFLIIFFIFIPLFT
ncbi:MAG: hypothetical protein PHS39_06095 [Atribacterota bacterium]|nr:hypothetical protein [Atribacterota bacterium]